MATVPRDHDWDGDTCRRCLFDATDAMGFQAAGLPRPPCAPITRVVNLAHRVPYDIRVDRASIWGNPFKVGRDGSRAEVIARYEEWIRTQPALLARLPELRGRTLACWCWPLPCHADVLARLADEDPMPDTTELTDADVAAAYEALQTVTAHHIRIKLPPVLAQHLTNIERCVAAFKAARGNKGPEFRLLPGEYPVTNGRTRVDVEVLNAEVDVVRVEGAAEPAAPLPQLSPDPTVLILDVETTGTNKEKDEIVELCIQFGFDTPEGLAPSETFLVKPSIPIPEVVSKIHGITDEHVRDAPEFGDLTAWLTYQFDQAQVIVGYNIGFDLEMIVAAFKRAKATPPDFSKVVVIDAFHLWRAMEPRKLSDAHQIFLGEKMEQAHEAAADVRATGRVALAMLERYGFLGKPWAEIQLAIDPDRQTWLGPSKHVVWKNGRVVWNFGKNSGSPLLGTDQGFFKWVLDKDFPDHVKTISRAALAVVRKQRTADQFMRWCAEQWPPPVERAAGASG